LSDTIRIREATAPGDAVGDVDGVEVGGPAEGVGEGKGSGVGAAAEGVLRIVADGGALGAPVTELVVAVGRGASQSL